MVFHEISSEIHSKHRIGRKNNSFFRSKKKSRIPKFHFRKITRVYEKMYRVLKNSSLLMIINLYNIRQWSIEGFDFQREKKN